MIPRSFLQAWSATAPWPDLRQVEQDLVICRALCDLFNAPALRGRIAFRGGTAIHKLLFEAPLRYSEDIDLVQARPEPVGPTIDVIRDTLSWLGPCKRTQAEHSTHLLFRFAPEVEPASTLRLKVELNTREHTHCLGIRSYPFAVRSDWYAGEAEVKSFQPEELFGTKLRAFLQRRRGRDLFDLHHGLEQLNLDPLVVMACFKHYLMQEGQSIHRAAAEQRMLEKLSRSLIEDVVPMLPSGVQWSQADAVGAFERVWTELIALIDGPSWKSADKVIMELRSSRYPGLLERRTHG